MIPILFWIADMERRRREETEDFIGHRLDDHDLFVAWAILAVLVVGLCFVVYTIVNQ